MNPFCNLLVSKLTIYVIPVKTGIQKIFINQWIPACAGMTISTKIRIATVPKYGYAKTTKQCYNNKWRENDYASRCF
jgi:hypothetical protein